MKRCVVVVIIVVPPLLLFSAVLVAGERLTREPGHLVLAEALASREHPVSPEPRRQSPPLQPQRPPAPAPQQPAVLRGADQTLVGVPPHLAAALQAVAPDISLCIPEKLERDRGPVDIDVRFTPKPGGGFAPGTWVGTSWDDEEIANCIAEVFDEATFLPSGRERFEPAQFVFHFPDDEMRGLLGLSFSPFR